MRISSRTPEGESNRCPICQADVCIEPSRPPGDAPCPSCGSLLWFHKTPDGWRLYDSEETAPIRDAAMRRISESVGIPEERLTLSASLMEVMGADSVDIVELVMALEEEFAIAISDHEAENIKTVGEAIDAMVRILKKRQ